MVRGGVMWVFLGVSARLYGREAVLRSKIVLKNRFIAYFNWLLSY
jgi:hypothetical protein